MGVTLSDIVVALPFAAAALLASVASWRAGVWINAAAASLTFLLACPLAWQTGPTVPAHLALLTSFVAMTTSWLGRRDLQAALAARRLDRRSARHHHVAFQTLLGALLLALLSGRPWVTWLGATIAVAAVAGLTAAVRDEGAQRAACRLLVIGGVALMPALFGTLLLYLPAAPDPVWPEWQASQLAVICLTLGYGGIAGLVPLHAWLADTIAEGSTQGAALVAALPANLPLLVMLRLHAGAEVPDAPMPLLVVLGLFSLLTAACCLAASPGTRRGLTFAGTAQVGIVVFAFGLGSRSAIFAGALLLTMLALVRAAAFQSLAASRTRAAVRTHAASVMGLAGLPILAFFLLAGPTAAYLPGLLLLLGLGVLLTTVSLIGMAPGLLPTCSGDTPATVLGLAPIWLELALVALLAAAAHGPAVGWFRTMAALR